MLSLASLIGIVDIVITLISIVRSAGFIETVETSGSICKFHKNCRYYGDTDKYRTNCGVTVA